MTASLFFAYKKVCRESRARRSIFYRFRWRLCLSNARPMCYGGAKAGIRLGSGSRLSRGAGAVLQAPLYFFLRSTNLDAIILLDVGAVYQ